MPKIIVPIVTKPDSLPIVTDHGGPEDIVPVSRGEIQYWLLAHSVFVLL